MSGDESKSLLGTLGAVWGILGVSYIIGRGLYSVWPYVEELDFAAFTVTHWIGFAVSMVFMGYAEGYKGFQLKFSPRVESHIAAALERLDMAERASERTRDLNGGHRRRLEIARCLIHGPSVLLLDEPTVGLDAAARSAITQHVHDLSAQDGLTVLWATHLTDEITPDDQLAILHQGKMLKQGTCRDITGDQPLQQVFLSMTGASA